ncbi:MurR/RpiR family transcriptional regulator [Clostridium paraputrificum]|uniref:MurR/RpiR family transcriptional regulator n=1 Tax=Clostridium TaxID=1485 RepID=UPI000EA2F9B6|nr:MULTISPECIES: MurR/RpiR family transcriptional regulator [Clostridium]MDB2089240.1 MurR/RpiR family transcriptional regulator [Clostridium paraputrificum]MDB2095632.1 MurR/RpiR family transcriptional regulator [Clostridium paraputrificum]MDB2102556.1 MurR/RpiR family transcriptional regulator [Clostridium paraputrificum]MDU1180769.1 MurR/RpiR family transcriptional regulator [Clostridium sp.]MDU1227273.1 MurR/RpiR family transcriptional regulator [Clostridium sp.]
MNFEERVLLNELRLTDTDDQVVDYIREDYNRFVNQSVQKVAEDLFTVPNTIVRLSKKLGYKGFSDLKFSLRAELEGKTGELKGDNFKNLELIPDTIKKTLDILDNKIIDKLVSQIKEAKNVYFVGIGDSIYFCEMFAKNIRCIGIKAEYFNHRHDMMYAAENCDDKDLFIAISVSGESKQILDVCKIAKERNASIVSMTHFNKNSLMDIADINIFFWAPRVEIHKYNAPDRIGIMLIIRIINEALWKDYNCV